MTNKNSPVVRRVRMMVVSVLRGLRKLGRKAKEKIDLDVHFSHLALKWDRISKGMVRLDPTFLGIFDREALTVTFRAGDSLKPGQLIETEHVQYRIGEMRPDQIQLPLVIDQVTHLVPCKVAVLVRI